MDDKPQRVVGEDGELLVPLHPDKRKRQPNQSGLVISLLIGAFAFLFFGPMLLITFNDDLTISDTWDRTALGQMNRTTEAHIMRTATAEALYPRRTVNLLPQTASVTINLLEGDLLPALIEGDLAWGRPAFASSYDGENYPVNVTHSTVGVWRSVGSTGTWFYVDLGEAQIFNQIITTLYTTSDTPCTEYIISDDLAMWRVVYTEGYPLSDSTRGHPRTLNLAAPVTARYVGLYAAAWDGGWGELSQFAVLLAETDAP